MSGVVVLISGRGSNLRALVEAGAPIVAVISNRADAAGLSYPRRRGIATLAIEHAAYATRQEFEHALAAAIDRFAPELIVLAGFMRVLSTPFVVHYPGRMINIHPSLLPAFPGLDTHRRALERGVKLHGATVHFVTPEVDGGPIIIQAAVPVRSNDDEATLAQRVLEQEHRILPCAVRWFLEGRLILDAGRVSVAGGEPQLLVSA